MNNRFINFLEFVTDDETAQAKNLYHPTQKLRTWEAQAGDFWRLLVKSAILRGVELSKVQVRIVEYLKDFQEWDVLFEDTGKVATLRKQYSESYSEFIIKLNEASTAGNYRQFALTRSNGQKVLGTVRETATDVESYAAKVQKHFESYPFTNVIVHRKGAVLAVRVYTNKQFYLDDEEVSIDIGQVPESNTNAPTLSSVFMETVSYPAQFSFALNIKNVEPGNRFELNGTAYEAQKGDTIETVKKALLGTATRLIVPQTQVNSVLATTGARTVINTNQPSIELSYFDTHSGNDRYIVSIGASIAEGNTYQIQAVGTTTKSYTATSSDTAATIRAALVEVSGYYEVIAGTVPVWLAVAGTQRIQNVNVPSMSLSDQQVIAAISKDKYRIIVGSDVQKGNEYTLGDTVYVATGEDTTDSVGIALGLTGSIGTFEVEEDTDLVCFARVGKKYTQEDICDVSIIQHPRIFKSNQWVLEVDWTGLEPEKTYCLQLLETKTGTVLGYSNLIELVSESPETSLLEVADNFDAVGYEYFEKGLTQKIRLPIYARIPKQRISENRTALLNGGYRRSSTVIETMREMVTRAEEVGFHRVLAAWLKHAHVWVNNEKCYCEGEYSETIISELSQKIQAKTTLIPATERNNKTTYFTTDSKPMRYGTIPLYGFVYGLRVILKTDSFEAELQEGSNSVPAADYEVVIYNDGDARKIRIAPEGLEEAKVMVPGQSEARSRRLIRVESGKTLEIYCEKTDAPSVSYQPEYAADDFIINGYTCEKTIAQNADFGDDFGNDFNNGN